MLNQLDDLDSPLMSVDDLVRQLGDDPEAVSLKAAVAELRTRHATLDSQAARLKQKFEVRSVDL